MFSEGLNTPFSYLSFIKERPLAMLKSLITVDILVPLATFLIILLVQPSRGVGIGLAILAASPAAPAILAYIKMSGGKIEYVTSLHVLLALLSVITVPLTIDILSWLLNFNSDVSWLDVAVKVGIFFFLPLLAGMAFRYKFPLTSKKLSEPLKKLSSILLLIAVAILLFFTYGLILKMDLRSYLAMILMITASLFIGHIMAAGLPGERITLALESASRHPGLALMIASFEYPLEITLTVLIPYIIVYMAIRQAYLALSTKYQKTL
jgi:BASS family bile acid:Na+ symporter